MQYKHVLPPTTQKPHIQQRKTSQLNGLFQQLGSNFNLSTLLLAGACLQVLLLFATRYFRYAFIIPFILLGIRVTDAILIHYNLRPNPYLEDVLPGRVTAIVPAEDGEIKSQRETVTILLLGAKSNHPFGVFAPKFLELGGWLDKMTDQFDSAEPPKGFLGQTQYENKDERGAREFTSISYWRSIEDLHEFAHSPLHRDAWMWWEKNLKELNAVGINHEIFQSRAGDWENVYVNFQPTGLGATTMLKKDGEFKEGVVDQQWISPLVDARRGKLAKSSARLGREDIKYDADRPAASEYV
jgi:heme-degrading monooxygenase HmoA